ncbi:FAD-binding oxidoreductase [Candidatus Peregrinibacteria bacterium]|nr:MAG: FAD-binding oxidoreductase [Candidatus Peregrinibacteria bacterium]
MTAFFVLQKTRKNVVLLEGNRVAHGATGHNAGQLVTYFETDFYRLVQNYGLTLAAKAYQDVLSAWDLLEEVQKIVQFKTPIHIFTGYAGICSKEELYGYMQNRLLFKEAGLQTEAILISSEYKGLKSIPKKYASTFACVPPGQLMNLLQTENINYFAAGVAKAGVTNSAHLTEELAIFLTEKYPDRFKIFEHSIVDRLKLREDDAVAEVRDGHHVQAKKVVLCTNGFENISILDHGQSDLDTHFHESVYGVIGYMAAYVENVQNEATAITYHDTDSIKTRSDAEIVPYFYLTRRPHGNEAQNSLVCLGGPETRLEDKKDYHAQDHAYPEMALADLSDGLKKNYAPVPKGTLRFKYEWHGLMGYTPSGLRCVGPEPLNPVLLYNLGCNGVGILPSIFGGKRVSDFLLHKNLDTSIFDPQATASKAKKGLCQ